MIEINPIHPGRKFPTIDFRFINRGDSAAILWGFDIKVEGCSIDTTPDFRFKAVADAPDKLVVSGTNIGWGAIKEAQFSIRSESLSLLFPPDALIFKRSVQSGDSVSLEVWAEKLRLDQFNHVATLLGQRTESEFGRSSESSLERGKLSALFSMLSRTFKSPVIPIGPIEIAWSGIDEQGNYCSGNSIAYSSSASTLWLSRNGFYTERYIVRYCRLFSDTTYCVILEPDQGPHERSYKISRTIAPGDSERFHILVGATKSSRLSLRFAFLVDKDDRVCSDLFTLNIHNPRGSRWAEEYRDGDELMRSRDHFTRDRWSDYPFLSATYNRFY